MAYWIYMATIRSRAHKKQARNPQRYLRWGIGLTLLGLISLGSYQRIFHPLSINLVGTTSIPNQVDIVVAGAGTGGISAAIQAARMGSKVLLLEETDYIGGQLAAGVTTIDVGEQRWNEGIYREFENNMRDYYAAHQVSSRWPTCVTGACFEPLGTKEVLGQMLAKEPNITLALRTYISSVQKQNGQITGVTLNDGRTVNTKIIIDATEYGDVIPLTGANYRLGNGTKLAPSPNSCIQDITYTAVVKKYANGIPESLKINTPPPGYTAEIANMFATVVKSDGSNELSKPPSNWVVHNRYRGLPDLSTTTPNMSTFDITKTDLNLANDYDREVYANPTHRLSIRYIEDRTYRKQINCEAKLRTIQYIYYMQHSPGMENWSISTDEGYDTPYNREENNCPNIPETLKAIERNMPPIPYVRESRRGIGSYTLTAKDIKRTTSGNPPEKSFNSSIALGSYPTDLHNCNSADSLEKNLESISDSSHVAGPVQIPLEALYSTEVKGLIFAEKNISQSRLANGTTRLQPSTMLTGQAAGVLAALANKNNQVPENISTRSVQQVLLANNGLLIPFSDLVTESSIPNVPFSKKYTQHPASASIQDVYLRGVMNGYTRLIFGPNNPINRGEVAVILVAGFKLPKSTTYQSIFSDVPIQYPYASFVEAMYTQGITAGCSQNPRNYCPEKNITKAEAAIFLLSAWRKTNTSLPDSLPAKPTYLDVPPSHWAYRFVETLAAHNIKWYCDEQKSLFCPTAEITRGDITIPLARILQMTN